MSSEFLPLLWYEIQRISYLGHGCIAGMVMVFIGVVRALVERHDEDPSAAWGGICSGSVEEIAVKK